jgi:hypothetical protein
MTDWVRASAFTFGWIAWSLLVGAGLGWVVFTTQEAMLPSIAAVVAGFVLVWGGFFVGLHWLVR